MSASLATGAERRPNLVSEYRQPELLDRAESNVKRLPPKITLPSFGRKPSSTLLDSHTVVCYVYHSAAMIHRTCIYDNCTSVLSSNSGQTV